MIRSFQEQNDGYKRLMSGYVWYVVLELEGKKQFRYNLDKNQKLSSFCFQSWNDLLMITYSLHTINIPTPPKLF